MKFTEAIGRLANGLSKAMSSPSVENRWIKIRWIKVTEAEHKQLPKGAQSFVLTLDGKIWNPPEIDMHSDDWTVR